MVDSYTRWVGEFYAALEMGGGERVAAWIAELVDQPAGPLILTLEAPEILFACAASELSIPLNATRTIVGAVAANRSVALRSRAYIAFLSRASRIALDCDVAKQLGLEPEGIAANPESDEWNALEWKWASRCALVGTPAGTHFDPQQISRELCFRLHRCDYLPAYHLRTCLDRTLSTSAGGTKFLARFLTQVNDYLRMLPRVVDSAPIRWEVRLLSNEPKAAAVLGS